MAGEVDRMRRYLRCDAHLTYSRYVPNYDSSVHFQALYLISSLFYHYGVSGKVKIRFEVHRISTRGSCLPIFRSFYRLVRE